MGDLAADDMVAWAGRWPGPDSHDPGFDPYTPLAVDSGDVERGELSAAVVERAIAELRRTGVLALVGEHGQLLPRGLVAEARAHAERSWCALAEKMQSLNKTDCFVWGLHEYSRASEEKKKKMKDACIKLTTTKEFQIYPQGRFGMMDMPYGTSAPVIDALLQRALKFLAPVLRAFQADYLVDVRGFLRHQSPYGGRWHQDNAIADMKHGNGISINIPLQAVGPANGGTMFLPWTKGEGTKTAPYTRLQRISGRAHLISPELPAGSLLLYDY